MLGSHPISAILGADVHATDDTAVIRSYIKGLTDVGLYVLLIAAGSKVPADYRTVKQISDDNEVWRAETGNPESDAPGGIHLATNDMVRLRSYVTRYRKDKRTPRIAPYVDELKPLEKRLTVAEKKATAAREVLLQERRRELIDVQSVDEAKVALMNTWDLCSSGELNALPEVREFEELKSVLSPRVNELNNLIDAVPDDAPVNLAIDVGRSGLIVVDCDTAEQRHAFCDWWASKSGINEARFAQPTVLSPGQRKNGVWVHRDGGHFYFTTDGIDLPLSTGKMTVHHNGEQFDVFWRDRYVLIPPSTRSEGTYHRLGPVLGLRQNEWLYREILAWEEESKRPERDHDGLDEETSDALKEWWKHTSWAAILVPHGWELTGTDRSCGCQVWGHPNGRSNDKSATAHEPGCSSTRYNAEDPPIHFWTSNPGLNIANKLSDVSRFATTLSKLQLYAALNFGGDDGLAMSHIPELRASQSRVVFPQDKPFGMSLLVSGDSDEDDPPVDHAATKYVVESYATPAPSQQTPVMAPPPTAPSAYTTRVTGTGSVKSPYTLEQLPFGMSGVSSRNLVGPATINTSPENVESVENVTSGVTGNVTTPVPGVITGTVPTSVTQTLTPYDATRYETCVSQAQPHASSQVAPVAQFPVQTIHTSQTTASTAPETPEPSVDGSAVTKEWVQGELRGMLSEVLAEQLPSLVREALASAFTNLPQK